MNLYEPLVVDPLPPSEFGLEDSLSEAADYASWARAAIALDERSGRAKWKARLRSNLYDWATIQHRLEELRGLRERGDSHGLVFAIEEGVHGNLGGMGRPILYSKARFGTKQLIGDYVEAVSDALLHIEELPESEMSAHDKRDLFQRASHCYGRSALMLSAGGALMYFHCGVVKALHEQGLLPQVISGSSAGAVMAGMLGTHTDEELQGLFTPENVRFGDFWVPNTLEKFTGLRRMFDFSVLDEAFARLVPDMTFREAWEHSRRHISISVSPNERHHSPRLLNAITAPHVLIRSAVRASCAVPGVYAPVQLQARNRAGETVNYLKSRWVDGLFAADLPAKQLARLYGANHFIVSLINPLTLPTFVDHRLRTRSLRPFLGMAKSSARNAVKSADVILAKYVPSERLGLVNKLLHDLLSQDYVGDISITPRRKLVSPFKLLSPYTREEVAELILDGERQTWPRIEMIRICTQVSRTLAGILQRLEAD